MFLFLNREAKGVANNVFTRGITSVLGTQRQIKENRFEGRNPWKPQIKIHERSLLRLEFKQIAVKCENTAK